MAREFSFKAILNFSIDNHAEFTSMRTTALNFASANGGIAKIMSNEDSESEIPYYARLILDIPVASRAEASSLMGTIDNALSGMPDLVEVNGKELKYDFEEVELA